VDSDARASIRLTNDGGPASMGWMGPSDATVILFYNQALLIATVSLPPG
jgi:hypothetical protein